MVKSKKGKVPAISPKRLNELIKRAPKVEEVIRFIEKLTVPSGTGAGKPFKLRFFQKLFIYNVYGPTDKLSHRIVRRAILSIARKNGKTALIAALALAHLVGPVAIDNGEIYSAANDREQAALTFKYAAQIVRMEPDLLALVKIIDSTKSMVCYGNGSSYKAISAEAGTKFGLNPTVVIYDELAQAKKRDLYDALDTSMAAREEPLFIVISTQSNDPNHVLSQLIDDGLSGEDPTTICHLYAVPEDEKEIYSNISVWEKANPALGDFRSLGEMKTFAAKAKRMPIFESTFRNLYLNQRVSAISPLIPRAEWEKCLNQKAVVSPGSDVYLGLDLSGKTDLSALGVIEAGEKDTAHCFFWKPAESIKDHEKRDRVPYSVWVKKGFIETTPGRAIQYDWIAERLAKINVEYNILGLAFDRWRIDDLRNAMDKIGLESYVEGKDTAQAGAIRLVPWGQGFASMTPAVEATETSILQGRFVHNGNPVLTWNFANALSISDAAGNRKIDKSKARFRIDGAVAVTMAIGLKSRDKKVPEAKSSYNDMTEDQLRAALRGL